jgi:acetyltransferase-like isoleucine patch superfamily enzyme
MEVLKLIYKIIRRVISRYKTYKFSKKIIIGKRILFGRSSKIKLQDNSQKGDIVIADDVMMLGELISQNGGKIFLSEKVNIRGESIIGAVNSISIGEGTIISNNVTIMDNNNHPVSPSDRKCMVESGWSLDGWLWKHSDSGPIVIGKNVWIGQFARINKNVTIGDNSIIGADAVVTKDVPADSIAAGNPSRVLKRI